MEVSIGIIGNGFVGKATQLLCSPMIIQKVYDNIPEKCSPLGTTLDDIRKCDIIFVCVPTPMKIDGSCDTSIVEKIVKDLNVPNIIIRSTIPLGLTEKLNCHFMPEFLTEANWKEDFRNAKNWIFGINENLPNTSLLKTKIRRLINYAYDDKSIFSKYILFRKPKEAEILKLIANTFLSTKVIYFNEMYDLCAKENINYENVTELLALDDRIGKTHMMVPGYNNRRGYAGTCFPKDTNNFYALFHHNNLNSSILESNLKMNELVYRTDKDWLSDNGRTISNTNKKVIVVVGGAGFIGTNLCRELLKDDNNQVVCVDNLSTGKLDNIQDLLNNKNFVFKKHDIVNMLFIPRCDEIYHLACPASPPEYQRDPIKTLETNFIGTSNILKLAVNNKSKVLFTSTSEVYGDPNVHPQPETYWGNVNPIGIRSCYDEGKRVAETLMIEYKRKYNLDAKIVRIFNTYGPYMDINDGRVITNFIKAIKNDTKIPIYGEGTQTRSFCYVDDMVYGLIKMMNSNESGPINLGNPDTEFQIKDLVGIFENIISSKLNVEYLDLPSDDPKQRKPIIDNAIEKLNWYPIVSLKDGLEKTYNYFN